MKLFEEYYGPGSVPNGLKLYQIKDQSLLREPSRKDGAVLIAITIIDAFKNTADKLKAMHRIEDSPLSIADLQKIGWTCLGYDVADQWLYSCLMNCGYDPDEKRTLSLRFSDVLNGLGLFDSVKAALDFCIGCDLRAPVHAPFSVYGIWCHSGEPASQV